MRKTTGYKKIIAGCAAVMIAAGCAVPAAAYGPVREVEINSGAAKGAGFVSVNEEFTTDKGTYRVVMTGLKEDNREAVINALAENYDPDSEDGLKLIDEAFSDAEKFDVVGEDEPEEGYDRYQCWAASASNMLWISGWSESLSDPGRDRAFGSEDNVFEYFNTHFSDKGSDILSGVEWFFDGEYFVSGPKSRAGLFDENNPENGLMKDYAVKAAQQRYDLVIAPEDIEALLRLDGSSESPAVFGASIGTCTDNTLEGSSHAVSIAGVICDPEAAELADRYKGIIIIDSDNDAEPGEEASKLDDPTLEQKEADKEARPNSYTVYNLKYTVDSTGIPYWCIVGYAEDYYDEYTGETYEQTEALYNIYALELPSDEVKERITEQYGTKNALENVDFTIELVLTTERTEAITDLFMFDYSESVKKVFRQGEPVNFNYFLQNRTNVDLDENYAGGQELRIDWKVTRNSDGAVVAEGTDIPELPLSQNIEIGRMIHLNGLEDPEVWEPGEYTVSLTLNPDRAVTEAYYLNNEVPEFTFTVEEAPEDSQPEDSDTSSQPDSSEPAPETEDSSAPESTAPKDSVPKTGAGALTFLAAAAGGTALVVVRRSRRE